MNLRPQHLRIAAWAVSILATLGSLRYSGIGVLGIPGLGLIPCELCWYQRILMYPLAGILGLAALRASDDAARIGFWMAAAGAFVALYHSLIQHLPHLEPGQCSVGTCTAILYRVLGLTIPNQSLLAFTLIAALLFGNRRMVSSTTL